MKKMKRRIWIIDDEWPNYAPENEVFAHALGDYVVRHSTSETFRKDLENFGFRADAILSQIDIPFDREVINRLENCRILSSYGTGYNNIDLQAARKKGIPVGFVPGYCAEDIADYVFSVLYAVKKPVFGYEKAILNGRWGGRALPQTPHRLCTVTLFLVGFGHIGAAVAKKASSVGVKVLAWSPSLTAERAAQSGARVVSLEEGLRKAEFVSLHLRYCSRTEKFFGATYLQKMKSEAWLLNTARGGVLDQKALIAAVQVGKIHGAFLDVLEKEPPSPDDPVLHCKGIYVTPHISYDSKEALQELKRRAAENAIKVLTQTPGADLVSL